MYPVIYPQIRKNGNKTEQLCYNENYEQEWIEVPEGQIVEELCDGELESQDQEKEL